MEEKFLIVKFHKGITYKIPATVIAANRAKYFAEVDEGDSQEYLDEIRYVLDNEFELFDWVQNDMNWSDLKDYAIRVEDDIIDE